MIIIIKIVHLFKHYYLGFSLIGLAAFIIQELPYMIIPFIHLKSNPIMNMQKEIKWIEITQGILSLLSVILLLLIVRDDAKAFSIATIREKVFFAVTMFMILINFVGWIFYDLGHQYGWLIVITQFAAVPLYYLFFGLWTSNVLLVGSASLFFMIHTVNGYLNFIAK